MHEMNTNPRHRSLHMVPAYFLTNLQIKKKVDFSTSDMVPLDTYEETMEGLGV